MPISSICHFYSFSFRSLACHEELNVHEKLLLFTLAVDEYEFAETDREVRRREDVEPFFFFFFFFFFTVGSLRLAPTKP